MPMMTNKVASIRLKTAKYTFMNHMLYRRLDIFMQIPT